MKAFAALGRPPLRARLGAPTSLHNDALIWRESLNVERARRSSSQQPARAAMTVDKVFGDIGSTPESGAAQPQQIWGSTVGRMFQPAHSSGRHFELGGASSASSARGNVSGSTVHARIRCMPHARREPSTSRSASSTGKGQADGKLLPFDRQLFNMGKMLKRGDVAGVLAIFEEVKGSGTASHLHYNIAISALASAHDPSGAGLLFAELDARGEADSYSYGAYSSALCRAGKLEEAVTLVESMASRNVSSNIVIYSTLFHGAIAAGHMQLAKRLMRDVEKLGLGYSEMFLFGLLRLIGREGSADAIVPAWRTAIRELYQSSPDTPGAGGLGGGDGSGKGRGCSAAAIAALSVAFALCQRPKEALRALQVLQVVYSSLPNAARAGGARDDSWTKQVSNVSDFPGARWQRLHPIAASVSCDYFRQHFGVLKAQQTTPYGPVCRCSDF